MNAEVSPHSILIHQDPNPSIRRLKKEKLIPRWMSSGFKGLLVLERDGDTSALVKIVLKQAYIKEKNGNDLMINPPPITSDQSQCCRGNVL